MLWKKFLIFSSLLALLFSLVIGLFYNPKTRIIKQEETIIQVKNNIEVKKQTKSKIENNFAILPHFMLNKNKVDEFYKFLVKKYGLLWKKLNIVLISPNHFWEGNHQFIWFNTWNVCFQNECINFNSIIDKNLIFNWYGKNKFISSDDLQFKIWNRFYTHEHGLGSHFEFLKKYFPNSKYYSLVLAPHKFKNLDKLINYLQNKFTSNTLFLASVDMSHYNKENFAYLHDKHTFYVLNNSVNKKDYLNLEVDCPTCLYIENNLANKNWKYPHLWYRDSSATILWKDTNFDNTSRMFIYFDKKKENKNWITIVFFWDVMYERWIKYYFPTKEKFYKFLGEFFMKKDIKHNPAGYRHRKLIWVDFAGFNLETPVVENKKICQSSNKSIRFCSNYKFLYWLKNIWFNILTFANNHAMDGWIPAFKNTVENVKNVWINWFGFVTHWKYYKNNFVYTWEIRWIKFAWHGYDFTLRKKYVKDYCNDLKKYKKLWYLNFVVVHWWIEYETKHNLLQKIYWEKLIDCGADLIIWAHPHVIQDIWHYKWKLIIYSLWNFIFDQFNVEGWNVWWYVLVDINEKWKVNWSNLWKFKIKKTWIEF
jgi:AmmeMemoRadiSam system protein B